MRNAENAQIGTVNHCSVSDLNSRFRVSISGLLADLNRIVVVVTDSAEENIIFKKLAKRCGFKVIDYCKYKANNFISTVYALFIDRELSPSDVEIEKQLAWKHEHIIEKE